MRVMCIKRGAWVTRDDHICDGLPFKGPSYGDICEVISSVEFEVFTFYRLYGWPLMHLYNAKSFIRLSDEENKPESESVEMEFEK